METNVIEQGFQRVWQLFQESERRFEKTEREIEKTARQIRESDKKLEKYFGKVKELDRSWGALVEALIKPSVARQFQKRNLRVTTVHQRVESRLQGETMEIDLFLENGDTVVIIEVKTTLKVADVNDHIEKRLKPFKRFFPRYADVTVYGAVAYVHVEENADRHAYQKGLFVLTFTAEDMVTILNDAKFTPVNWGEIGSV